MSGDPICTTHGWGFGTPCYLCVDEENRRLKADRLALAERAVRAGIEAGIQAGRRAYEGSRAIAARVIAEDER